MYRKYKNKKIETEDGVFDSKREYERWQELKMLEKTGAIAGLKRQVKYELIPQQREPDTIGKRGGVKKGKVLERECTYVADFVYSENGKLIAEDTKGFKTEVYRIKKKLMLYVHGIRIRES